MSCIRLIKGLLIILSILSGALFAVVWRHYELVVSRIGSLHSPLGGGKNGAREWSRQLSSTGLNATSYADWLAAQGLVSVPIPREELSYGRWRGRERETESAFLFNRSRVLCMVMAGTKNRSRALRHTWTRHCNEVVFFAKFADRKNDRLVRLQLLDNSLLSPRTFCRAFVGVTSGSSSSRGGGGGWSQFDWLLITTDHTYAIVDNLRQYLAPVNASTPLYLGRPVHHYFLGVYNALDSGIVLSRGAVQLLLAEGVFTSDAACLNIDTGAAVYSATFDAYIGMLLARRGVRPANTLDARGGSPPMCCPSRAGGLGCCSQQAITFTGFTPVTMYFIDYLLYHLAGFTEADGQTGIGNMPSYESYRVPSELDDSRKEQAAGRRRPSKHKVQ
ncbi:hypothetical protein TYRP_005918 [Tyrophagus putrescentiae]|nr:hypothetical protein TYRP_005918 [Tyrophagus putrescentiae]